jgi:hypothetical protein
MSDGVATTALGWTPQCDCRCCYTGENSSRRSVIRNIIARDAPEPSHQDRGIVGRDAGGRRALTDGVGKVSVRIQFTRCSVNCSVCVPAVHHEEHRVVGILSQHQSKLDDEEGTSHLHYELEDQFTNNLDRNAATRPPKSRRRRPHHIL